ncbi:MAG TPA: cytochrome c [Lacunisphaera sp.]
MKSIGPVVIAVFATIAALAIAALAFTYLGTYDVAATRPHLKPVEAILRTAAVRSVKAHARQVTPPGDFKPQDRALAEHAAGHYELMCRTCHGAPGRKPDPWQLYPPAPDLTDGQHAAGWNDAEIFWIIKNGIKDSGMSAFGGSHSDDDLWALTALIRQLGAITPEQYQTMNAPAAAPNQKAGHQPAHREDQAPPGPSSTHHH